MRISRVQALNVIVLAAITGLAGCGGGGGGDAAPANRAPTANAGADQTVDPQTQVSLTGAGTDSDGSVASFAWSQVSGTAVALTGADQASASFTAPAVAVTSTLGFRLTVTDDDGATGIDDITVTVAVNQAPTANAGADQTVQEGTQVTLTGAGTDADGTIAAYRWTQVAGPAVALSSTTQATVTFTAPTAAAAPLVAFELVVTDDDGADSVPDQIDINVVDQVPANVTLSGLLQYEYVNRGAGQSNGLNFNDIDERPIRGATVQAIDAGTQQVLATATADATGNYSLTVPSQRNVFVRVRSELKQGGAPAWDVEVRDNTSNTTQALSARPIYALDGAAADTGIANSVRNLTARTGWGGTSYTGPRAAAPFAVLDTIYESVQFVVAVDPVVVLPPLDAFWSVNNCPTQGNIDTGDIGTSFYRTDIDSLFLLGCANVDTEEFDSHVIAHEWGHYFEDVLSRSDSIGGQHSGSERLDMRLAFGEGWGNAVAGMILDNPVYRDSFGTAQGQSFQFSVEGDTNSNLGWFNEFSVQFVLYDLYDSNADGVDNVNLGFAPLYGVLTGEQRNTAAFTSVFPFLTALRNDVPGEIPGIDAIAAAEGINSAQIDPFGSNETNDAGGNPDVLPIYTPVGVGTNAVVCMTRSFDPGSVGNKLGLYRYLRFSLNAQTTLTFNITKAASPAVAEATDPDILIYRTGVVQNPPSGTPNIRIGESGVVDSETATFTLPAGDYVAEIYEFNNIAGSPLTAPRVCFDVNVS